MKEIFFHLGILIALLTLITGLWEQYDYELKQAPSGYYFFTETDKYGKTRVTQQFDLTTDINKFIEAKQKQKKLMIDEYLLNMSSQR